MNDEELLDILIKARSENNAHSITGMLLYSQGTFIQVLEGEKENVDRIFKKIESDTRHKNVIKLMNGVINQRNFPGWSMAFASVNSEILQSFEGFLDPADPSFLGSNNDTTTNMLRIFAQANNLTY